MKAVVFDRPGDESVLRWDEAPDPDCRPNQVVLRAKSTSVNRADLLQRLGVYPPPPGASPILGLEVAGTVDQVGSAIERWSVGDDAMALVAGGGYAERVAVDGRHLLPIPKNISLLDAGGVPEVFLTAYLNLIELGQLESGQRVLIHGGSGGVGTAAIQIAAEHGAEVWTTAGSDERADRCTQLGAHRALNYRTADFAAELKKVGGANLILDIMGAKYLSQNMKSLRKDGRLVIIGLQGGIKAEINLGLALAKRLTVIGSTLRARSDESKAALIEGFMDTVWPWLDNGKIKLVVDRRLPISSASAAHKVVAASDHFGKVILEVGSV